MNKHQLEKHAKRISESMAVIAATAIGLTQEEINAIKNSNLIKETTSDIVLLAETYNAKVESNE